MKLFFLKNNIVIILVLLLFSMISCGEGRAEAMTEASSVNQNKQKAYAVKVSMEEEALVLKQERLMANLLTKKKDTLQFLLWAEDYPLKLNLNLNNTTILEEGEVTYTIPDVNTHNVKVELNFFSYDRDVNGTNKRIIFKKETIRITKIHEHDLHDLYWRGKRDI